MPKNILIISKEPYGNTDFVEFSRIAKDEGFDVSYICNGVKKGVIVYPSIIDISLYKMKSLYRLFFSFYAFFYVMKNVNSKEVFIHVRYYRGASLLSFLRFFGFDICCDVRSGNVGKKYNTIKNFATSFELKFFPKVSILSKGLAGNILKLKNFSILPLGANLIPQTSTKISYDTPINFVYVGTFNERKIQVFAKAFHQACNDYKLEYVLDIYGYGSNVDINAINSVCNDSSFVRYHGVLDRVDFDSVLLSSDIGVCYVPICKKFNYQPPTKTYEYLCSGLPVIATATSENMNIITNGKNGWLHGDSYDEVYNFIYNTSFIFISPVNCIKSVGDQTWKHIFKKHYLALIGNKYDR